MIEVEVRPAGPGPVGEQRGGLLDRQRRDRTIRSPSTPSASRLVASTDTRGQCCTIRSINSRGGVQHVLTVVDHQQQFARPQVLDHRLLDVQALPLLQPQRRRNGVAHRRAVVQRRKFAHPHTVAEALLLAVRRPPARAGSCRRRRPRSASPAGPHAAPRRRARFLLAADEAGRAPRQRKGRRQAPAAAPERRRGWPRDSPSRICWCTLAARGSDRRRAPRPAVRASADRCPSASACRPLRYWASISCPARRSSSGCACRAAPSSPSSSACRPARSAASLRSSSTENRSASREPRMSLIHGVSSEANGSPATAPARGRKRRGVSRVAVARA